MDMGKTSALPQQSMDNVHISRDVLRVLNQTKLAIYINLYVITLYDFPIQQFTLINSEVTDIPWSL